MGVSWGDTMCRMDECVLGENIRALREKSGLTVTAAALRADLTKSTLSKIEKGQVSPPIATLVRIAKALEVGLTDFFAEPEASPAYVLTRKGEGRVITRDGSKFGYSYEALALEMPRKSAEPFVLCVRPGDPVGRFQHGGQEFIYMLAGKLAFTVGKEELVLRPGDSLYFDPTVVHTTRVMGKTAARFLCLFLSDSPKARPTRRGRK